MQCLNCGAELMGIEHACPVCGRPLPAQNQPPMISPEAVQQTAMPGSTPVQVTPEVPQGATPVPAQSATAPTTNDPKEKKPSNNKGLIIIISIAIVVLLGIIVYFVVFANSSNKAISSTDTSSSSDTETTKIEETGKSIEYAGYTFKVPLEYETTISPLYGLLIYNAEQAYSIAVDYSNNIDSYKTTLSQINPEKVVSSTVSGREFLAITITDESSPKGTQYITKKVDNVVFVGVVTRKDNELPTTADFLTLTDIIDSAAEGGAPVEPGAQEDAGTRIGIIFYTIDPNVFVYSTEKKDSE